MRGHRLLARSVSALAFLAAACGGGGGGGGPNPSVQVSVDDGQVLAAEIMLGDSVPFMSIQGQFTGDVDALAGRTIYVAIDYPEGLYTPGEKTAYPGGGWSIVFWGAQPDTVGHFTGDVTIRVFFDEAGTQEVEGSPMFVPYDVTVLEQLYVDTTPIVVHSTFGDPATTRTLQNRFSEYTASWGASFDYQNCGWNGDLFNPNPLAEIPRVACTVDGSVTITIKPEPPGTHEHVFTVQSVVLKGRSFSNERQIPVTHVVAENPDVPAVFFPAETVVVTPRNQTNAIPAFYELVLNTGATEDGPRQIEYLSHPPEAEGNPDAQNWWSEYPYASAATRSLPPGTYTARVRYPIVFGGVQSYVDHPVRMEVLP